MFENTKVLLEEKRAEIIIKSCLEFTKKINEYIKAKGYKEGKDYTLLTDEEIINKTEAGTVAHHIDFIKDNIKLSLENNDNIEYYYGISYNGKDKKTINKSTVYLPIFFIENLCIIIVSPKKIYARN